jgi:cell division transport system ATP-binding protein
MEALITIKNFSRWYPGSGQQIFRDFNFTLEQGDFCCIMGTSGVGKTTLIKFLTRQLQSPKGTIFSKHLDLHSMDHREVQAYRRKVGIVFQDYKLLDWKTVGANVAQSCEIHHMDPTSTKQKTHAMLRFLWLEEKYDMMPATLSGWEKQRVAIARAMVMQPEFLIADEATGNLDEAMSRTVMDAFLQLHRQGNTILCITHDTRLVEYIESQWANVKKIYL